MSNFAASFSPATQILRLTGGLGDDTATVGRDVAGEILVDGGATPIGGGPATVADTVRISVSGSLGDDRVLFDEANGPLPAVTFDGSLGNDTVTSGAGADKLNGGLGDDSLSGRGGADTLDGGLGDDVVLGGTGNDVALLGLGNDTFIWNPGEGSDKVEGGLDFDTLVFNGAGASENVDITAIGGRARFFRDVANITMDLNDVERIDFAALGGTDKVVVGDLAGTDVKAVNIDLAATLGGAAGDGQADGVTVNGTARGDAVTVAATADGVVVSGQPAGVTIAHAEATDQLVINGQGGADLIDARAVTATALSMTVDGGAGADTLLGGAGAELLLGGDGDDVIDGGRGNDVARMGAGNDTFIWDPGEGSDTLEGEAGFDAMVFNGAGAAENIDIAAIAGGHARFFRDVASITMDLNDVERIDFNALGGTDNIVVNDLGGTDVTQVNIDLAATLGGAAGDGAVDKTTLNGTAGGDTVTAASTADGVVVGGLPATVTIEHFEATDQLVINGQGGDDRIDASGVTAGALAVRLVGGAGNDIFIGKGVIVDDFQGGAGPGDVVDLSDFAGAVDFAAVLAHATQVAADTVIDFGAGDIVTLANITLASLAADDFVF